MKKRDGEQQRRLQTRHALNNSQQHRERRRKRQAGGERKVEQIGRDRTGSQNERRRRKARMKMRQRETDKTRMLKGFQSRGCLGSSIKRYAKAISIEPLLGK